MSTTASKAKPPKPPPALKQRSVMIDVARGIAISLMALGHTNQGEMKRGYWGTNPFGIDLDRYIYTFHMPAFFFVAGIFLIPSIQKRGYWRFTVDKLRTLIYPYILWNILGELSPLLLKNYEALRVPTPHEFVMQFITGSFQWFLPTLFFAVIVSTLLRRIPLPLLFVLTCAASQFVPFIHVTFIDLGVRELPFVVLGMCVGRRYEQLDSLPQWLSATLAAALAVLLGYFALIKPGVTHAMFLPYAVLGTAMLLCLASAMGRNAATRALAWAGEGSLGVFLLSSYFQGGTRAILQAAHLRGAWMNLLVPSLMATIIPAWIYNNRVRLHIDGLFVAPWGYKKGHRKTASKPEIAPSL